MKNIINPLLALLVLSVSSCNKEEQPKLLYDNSNSYVSWIISPPAGSISGEGVTSPTLISGWNFNQQFCACRMALTANASPFYGYPTGAFTVANNLSFDYSNGDNNTQAMALFFNSATPVTCTGTYTAVSSFANGYIARMAANGVTKNLYFTGGKQTIFIDGYNTGARLCNNSNVIVLSGRFQISVSDSINGVNAYQLTGKFQFPVINPN